MSGLWREISKLWKRQQMQMWWRHTKLRWLSTAMKGPLKYKQIDEGICAMCGRKEVVFPITIDVCPKCIRRFEFTHPDVRRYTRISSRKFDFNGHRCQICGRKTFVYYRVNTRICHNCTRKLGRREKKIYYIEKKNE